MPIAAENPIEGFCAWFVTLRVSIADVLRIAPLQVSGRPSHLAATICYLKNFFQSISHSKFQGYTPCPAPMENAGKGVWV